MKRKSSKPYFLLLAALFFIMSIPKKSTEGVRGLLFASMAPVWEGAQKVVAAQSDTEEEVCRLQAEVQLLHNQVEHWQELYQNERELNIQITQVSKLESLYSQDMDQILKTQLEAIPAKVIFRAPSSWNSSLWVNVGSADNETLGKTVITKNSPVVIGSSVVGILDYVGKHQSRVRLITDSGVVPSVRAVRGEAKNRRVLEMITLLERELEELTPRKELLFKELLEVKEQLGKESATWFLAKGELRGSSRPIWRSQSSLLKGVGFNYDFADRHGPARDLRTGEPQEGDLPSLPVIEEDDLLITTGMDGIFPPGLYVARVNRIDMLKEGDYSYELEAVPTAGNLDELTLVFILPSQGFDSEDQAPYYR